MPNQGLHNRPPYKLDPKKKKLLTLHGIVDQEAENSADPDGLNPEEKPPKKVNNTRRRKAGPSRRRRKPPVKKKPSVTRL